MTEEVLPGKNIVDGKYVYLEFLRIFAVFWVIYNHTGGNGFTHYLVAEGVARWIEIFLACFCKVAVPLFLMISGAVLMEKEESISQLFKKRIARSLELILLVSVVQYIYWGSVYDWDLGIKQYLTKTLFSFDVCSYYLWLYLGLLLILPLLRLIAKDRKVVGYFSICVLLFYILRPVIEYKLNLGVLVINNYIPMFTYLCAYPLVGYFIHTLPEKFMTKKYLWILAGAAVASLLISMLLKQEYAVQYGQSLERFDQWGSIVAVFLFFAARYFSGKVRCPEKLAKVIVKVAPTSLGTFLLSAVLMWKIVGLYAVLDTVMPSVIAVLIWVFVSMVMCQAITAILRLIPPIKKIL